MDDRVVQLEGEIIERARFCDGRVGAVVRVSNSSDAGELGFRFMASITRR